MPFVTRSPRARTSRAPMAKAAQQLPPLKITSAEEELIEAFRLATNWALDTLTRSEDRMTFLSESLGRFDLTALTELFSFAGSGFGDNAALAIVNEILAEGAKSLPRTGLGLAFDRNDPRAIAWAREQGAKLVADIDRDTREIVRQIVVDSFERQMTTVQTAQRLRRSIGLTTRWERAVQRTWQHSYDQAIKAGQNTTAAEQLASKVSGRQRDRLIRARAKMIARTEIMTAANAGRYLGWVQAREKGLIAPSTLKEWVTAPELSSKGRPCGICLPYDRVRVRLDQNFPNGFNMPPAHPNAVLAGSTFQPYGQLQQVVRSYYRGPAILLATAQGDHTTIGPNHPVLTRRGMVKARLLSEGDELVYDRRLQNPTPGDVADLDKVPLVEDAFETLWTSSSRTGIAKAGHDFHGDRVFCEDEIYVVEPERDLLPVADSMGVEQLRDLDLTGSDVQTVPLPRDRTSGLDVDAVDLAAAGGVRWPSVRHESPFEYRRIVAVDVRWFEGWAYDASTTVGIYNSDGIVVSNCRCTAILVPPSVSSDEKRADAYLDEPMPTVTPGDVQGGGWERSARRKRREHDLPEEAPIVMPLGLADSKLFYPPDIDIGRGVAWRGGGREWLVEIDRDLTGSGRTALAAARRDPNFIAIMNVLDRLDADELGAVAARFNRSVAIVRGEATRNPSWVASASEDRMTFLKGRASADSLYHELGHNVDNALWDLGHGMPSMNQRWAAAARADMKNLIDGFDGRVWTIDADYDGFSPRVRDYQINDIRAVRGEFEDGITGYGTVNAREDYAESMKLFLRDRLHDGLGYWPDGSRVRFAAVWPNRAREITQHLTDLGKYAVTKGAGMDDVADAPLPKGVDHIDTYWFDQDGYPCGRADAWRGEAVYLDKKGREVGRDYVEIRA